MVDTFRLMNQIRLDIYKDFTQEELVGEYQKEENQSILAELFCRNFKSLCAVIYEARYNIIEKQDKVDCAMWSVYRALNNYDITKPVHFNTFLITNLRKRLATCMQQVLQKRHCSSVYSLDEMKENTDNNEYEKNFQIFVPSHAEQINLSFDINNAGLSDREKVMCKAILDNPNISNIELSQILKCHRHTVMKEKRELQQKLAFLIN